METIMLEMSSGLCWTDFVKFIVEFQDSDWQKTVLTKAARWDFSPCYSCPHISHIFIWLTKKDPKFLVTAKNMNDCLSTNPWQFQIPLSLPQRPGCNQPWQHDDDLCESVNSLTKATPALNTKWKIFPSRVLVIVVGCGTLCGTWYYNLFPALANYLLSGKTSALFLSCWPKTFKLS